MRDIIFYAELHREEDGGFWVSFPDVPEALTEGDTLEEALEAAGDALVTALGGYLDEGRALPEPKAFKGGYPVAVPPLEAAKIALHEAMRDADVSGRELARRLDIQETAMRRLLDLSHRSHIGEITRALNALGMRLSVSVEAIKEPVAA